MNHYVFDCKTYYKGDSFLSNERFLFYTLKRMAFMHGLWAITEPYLRPYYECEFIDNGISVVMLLENGGHITLHTFPRRHCYYMDILTEEDEFEKAKAYLKKFMPYIEEKSCIRALSSDGINERYDKRKHFGPHLIYEVENTKMDMSTMFKSLKELPPLINMKAICQPIVIEDRERIDGIVIIAESHISIHYCKESHKAYVDIFSCMPFDYDTTDKYVSKLGKILLKKVYARATKKEKGRVYYADN